MGSPFLLASIASGLLACVTAFLAFRADRQRHARTRASYLGHPDDERAAAAALVREEWKSVAEEQQQAWADAFQSFRVQFDAVTALARDVDVALGDEVRQLAEVTAETQSALARQVADINARLARLLAIDPPKLTKQERKVLHLLVQAKTVREINAELGMSQTAVQRLLDDLVAKGLVAARSQQEQDATLALAQKLRELEVEGTEDEPQHSTR